MNTLMHSLSIDQINQLSEDEFVGLFGQVVEHSSWVAKAASHARPYRNFADLYAAMANAISQAGPGVWAQILNLHPELSGKEAQEGALTDFSVSEQAGLGLDRLSKDEFQKIQGFNQRYKEKFGFPFVVCVKQLQNRGQLFSEMERRLSLSGPEELKTGIGQVMEICRLRLHQIVTAAES
jgi:2-oxo-4-hydroxy-4-carboxy-5-ureidoimidazoline decarboxylase